MKDKVLIAEIVAAHGIKGDFKIRSFASKPEDIKKYNLFFENGEKFSANFKSQNNEVFIASSVAVTNRNEAEILAGKKVYIDRGELPKLSSNEFYQADLIGLSALEKGANVGKVIAVHNFGSGDIIEIAENDSKKTFMLMLTKSNIKKIDRDKRAIEIERPEEV